MSFLHCSGCNKKHEDTKWTGKDYPTTWWCSKWYKVGPIEVVPDEIRRQRVDYAQDQVQSHRGGELSKEFVKLHPERIKGMVKEGVITEKEVKNAKDVWKKDLPGLGHL